MSSLGDGTGADSAVSKVAGMAPGVIADAAARASSAEGKLRHLAEKSCQDLSKTKDKTKETMVSALQCAKGATAKHPFLVAGAALALGSLAAILYKHK